MGTVMADTVTTANALLSLKLTAMDTVVDTDTVDTVMVDTEDTAMVDTDTMASDLLSPKPTVMDTAVVTDTADTVMAVDTVVTATEDTTVKLLLRISSHSNRFKNSKF